MYDSYTGRNFEVNSTIGSIERFKLDTQIVHVVCVIAALVLYYCPRVCSSWPEWTDVPRFVCVCVCVCVYLWAKSRLVLPLFRLSNKPVYTVLILLCSLTSYVYWTVHHVDSWIKIDQLDVTCFIISLFTAQHVSYVSTSIFRSLRLIVDLFHELYCSGSMCVGVTVWFGWVGVVSLCRLKH